VLADHGDDETATTGIRGGVAEAMGMLHAHVKRFLDDHVLAGQYGILGQLDVRSAGSADHNNVDVLVGEGVGQRRVDGGPVRAELSLDVIRRAGALALDGIDERDQPKPGCATLTLACTRPMIPVPTTATLKFCSVMTLLPSSNSNSTFDPPLSLSR